MFIPSVVRVSWRGMSASACHGVFRLQSIFAYWPLSHVSILMLMTLQNAVTGNCLKLISYVIVTVNINNKSYSLWAGMFHTLHCTLVPHSAHLSCGVPEVITRRVVTDSSRELADVPAGFVLQWNRRFLIWHIERNLWEHIYFHKTPHFSSVR